MYYITRMALIILLINNFSFAQQENQTCSRVAIYNNEEVLIDGHTSKKGSGLNKIMKSNMLAMKHLENYQTNNEMKIFNIASGTVSTASIFAGLLYTGSKANKNNLLIFGGLIALVNFLTTKTIEFYNERELDLAISEFNKTSDNKIRVIDKRVNKKVQNSIFLNKSWSF